MGEMFLAFLTLPAIIAMALVQVLFYAICIGYPMLAIAKLRAIYLARKSSRPSQTAS